MTSAALRRKWIYDNEQFVRGRIWSLEESAVQSLIELFTDSRGRLQQGLTDVFDRYAPGGQWTAGDAAFRQRTEYLLAQIDNEVAGLMAASQDATSRAGNQGLFNRTEMIARTEILRSSNLGAMQIYLENRDTIKGWQWLLTFDERTCEICIGKNAGNKVYTFENRETPPAHPRCRCTIVPVLHDGALERNIAGERMTYDQWAGSRGLQGGGGRGMGMRGRPPRKPRSTAAAQAAPGVSPA